MAHLGINGVALSELKQRLIEDNSGLSAAVWLGQLNAKLKAPAVKLSKAPKPDSGVKGDAGGGAATVSTLMKKYRDAHSSGNTQKAFDLKRQAKANGHDTSNW